MTNKTWPLDVQYLIDFEGDSSIVCYYSKGHHEAGLFCREAHEEHDVIIDPTDVVYKYMRWSMITGPDGPCHVGEEEVSPGRGRFPITISHQWSDQ